MPRTLVKRSPYVTRALARQLYAATPARYKTPLRVGYRAYTHYSANKQRYQAAGRIARWAYKRYKGRSQSKSAKRRSVGERPGTSNCKQFETDNSDLIQASRNLYAAKLTGIPRDDKAWEDRRYRERGVIKISGFRYCLHIRNNFNVPLVFHYAIVCPKNKNEFNLVPNDSFFRSMGTESRSRDFSTALTGQEFDCLPINSDKFIILKHKKRMIGPLFDQGSTNRYMNGVTNNYIKIDGYEQLNRQIRYDPTGNDIEEANPVWFVYWCDQFLASANEPAKAGVISIQRKFITYFRETNPC